MKRKNLFSNHHSDRLSQSATNIKSLMDLNFCHLYYAGSESCGMSFGKFWCVSKKNIDTHIRLNVLCSKNNKEYVLYNGCITAPPPFPIPSLHSSLRSFFCRGPFHFDPWAFGIGCGIETPGGARKLIDINWKL